MRLTQLCLLTLVATIATLPVSNASRPNILFILTDDQGWPTLGSYGGNIVPTPNLDRLAAEGARLTDFYVVSQCSPTRATFMTGQYTARHKLWHVLPWYGYPLARVTEPLFAENYPRDSFSVAKGLQAAGYRTAIVGKWHLTNNEDGNYMGLNPEAASRYGFDYAPPVIPRSYFNEGSDRGVDLFTDQTIEFISQNHEEPWFVFLSHHMIHGVVVAPESLTDKYREKGYGDDGPNRAVYLAGLEHIDRSIGRLLDSLDELGEAEETLIVFTSDNGGIDYRFDPENGSVTDGVPKLPIGIREYDNAPLRMGKGSGYEGGIRVPFIARWPGRIPPRTTIGTPAHIVDLLPTFFSAAEASIPRAYPIDGENLIPLLTGEPDYGLKDRPIYQYYPFYDLLWGITPSASVRQGDYKLIEFYGERVDDDGQYHPGHALELYNLRTDIGETQELSQKNPEIAQQLQETLRNWLDEIGAEVPELNPHFDPPNQLEKTRTKPDWLVK